MDNDFEWLAKRVKEYRIHQCVTLRELSRRSTVSTTYLWEIESGKVAVSALSLHVAQCIANGLGLTLVELLTPPMKEQNEVISTVTSENIIRVIEDLKAFIQKSQATAPTQ